MDHDGAREEESRTESHRDDLRNLCSHYRRIVVKDEGCLESLREFWYRYRTRGV